MEKTENLSALPLGSHQSPPEKVQLLKTKAIIRKSHLADRSILSRS